MCCVWVSMCSLNKQRYSKCPFLIIPFRKQQMQACSYLAVNGLGVHVIKPCFCPPPPRLGAVNFDNDRFVTMLGQAAKYQQQLQQQCAAKGIKAGDVPEPSALGWTGTLPHPMKWAYPGDNLDKLSELAKEVRV